MIRAVATRSKKDQSYPEVVGALELPTESIDRGLITDSKDVALMCRHLVAELEEWCKGRASSILISVSGAALSSSQVSGMARTTRGDAVVMATDIETALRDGGAHIHDSKNKEILHEIPLRFRLDGNEVTGNIIGLRGDRLEVRSLYVTYPRQHMDTLREMIKESKLEVSDIVAGPLAESVLLLTKKDRKAGALLINIGATTTSYVLYENNQPLLVGSVAQGGNDITRDIALGIKVSLDDAEKIKCGTSEALHSKRRVDEIIEARVSHICESINKDLERVHRRELIPSGVFVTGQGALLSRIDFMLRNDLRIPAHVLGDSTGVFASLELPHASFARAYGLSFFSDTQGEGEAFLNLLRNWGSKAKRYLGRFLP